MPVMNIVARPNAFCGHCKDEVTIADSLACPRCGEDVDVLSLTRELRERLVPEPEPVAPPPALLTLAGERRPPVQREIPEPVKGPVHARTEHQPERLALPNIPSVVAWYAGTQDTFDTLAEREAQLVAELRGVRQARKLLEAVLGRIEPARPDYVPPPAASKAEKRWALDYAACVDCGKADRPHMAKGRCRGCYGPWIKAGRPQ